MQSTHKRRGVLVLVVAAFTLLVTAVPASANPEPAKFNLEGGKIIVTQTGDDFEFEFGENGDPDPCNEPVEDGPSFKGTIDKKTNPIEVEINGANLAKSVVQDPNTGDWFQIELVIPGIFSNDGEISGTTWDQDLFLIADIWRLDEDGNGDPICDKGDVECQVGVQIEASGTYDPGPPQTGVLSSVDPTGDPIMIGSPCSSSLTSQLSGQRVIVEDLEVEIKK